MSEGTWLFFWCVKIVNDEFYLLKRVAIGEVSREPFQEAGAIGSARAGLSK